MKLVFVHGWAYSAAIWDDVAQRLPDYEIERIDFGYFGPVSAALSYDEPFVAVGHSLGVLWLLSQSNIPMKGLVSIAGFDNFSAHVNPALLKAMQLGLARRPERTLQDFWNTCGASPNCNADNFDADRLMEGLVGLQTWDGRDVRQRLKCPVLALAARDDKIVSQEMTNAIWPEETLRWVDGGNHALPLSEPDWCANEIANFANNIST